MHGNATLSATFHAPLLLGYNSCSEGSVSLLSALGPSAIPGHVSPRDDRVAMWTSLWLGRVRGIRVQESAAHPNPTRQG